MYNTLRTLCLYHSISGREAAIRDKINEMISPFVDETRVDNLGNLIALRRGYAEDKKKIMLCAHMDEIGFIVTYIEDKGFIRISTVGGINLVASAFSEVVSERGVKGVLVPESEVKSSDFAPTKFVIDIGAKSKKDAERRVKIGDFFVVTPSLTKLSGKRVAGRPLDDRIGCAVMLKIAKALSDTPQKHDVYYVFSVQEEVGLRGSKPATFAVSPDVALCFDVTSTGDTPSSKPMDCAVGKGAAVKIKDNSVICHPMLVSELCELAEKNSIPYQREVLTFGGTDTASMQLTGLGCMAGALSIPTRYVHSGVELCDMGDLRACIDLAEKYIIK